MLNKHINKQTVLVVDDQYDVRMTARFLLEDHHYQVLEADSPAVALFMLKKQPIDIVLLDMNYAADTTSGTEGLNFLNQLNSEEIDVTVIVMTAWSSIELAVEAMQKGAKNFIEKPWENERLLQILQQQCEFNRLQKENKAYKQQQKERVQESNQLQLQSSLMLPLWQKINKVAKTDATVLLTGENGTGKSSFARQIHDHSNRSDKPLVSVNMGAIPESLFESELFGHTKGAFTDAKSERIGRFELANGSTLFLDEIANISLDQQAKLLRVLETGEYEKVGASKTQLTDVRLIVATNANLEVMINEGTFRADLYFRLNTMQVEVPSLRERPEDILPLAEFFLAKHNKKYSQAVTEFSSGAINKLTNYPWPGNIRELSHVIERCVLLAETNCINSKDIDIKTELNIHTSPQTNTDITMMPLDEAEQRLIEMALRQTMGNIADSAELLKISQSSMYRRMEKYNINKFDLGRT